MKRVVLVAVAVVALCATVGCAFKMGNADMSLLNGLNQPTVSTEKTEKVNPTIKNESVAK